MENSTMESNWSVTTGKDMLESLCSARSTKLVECIYTRYKRHQYYVKTNIQQVLGSVVYHVCGLAMTSLHVISSITVS
jgi:hypothetical protein